MSGGGKGHHHHHQHGGHHQHQHQQFQHPPLAAAAAPASSSSNNNNDGDATFAALGIHPEVCAALAAHGMTHPRPLQRRTMQHTALDFADIIAETRPGAGRHTLLTAFAAHCALSSADEIAASTSSTAGMHDGDVGGGGGGASGAAPPSSSNAATAAGGAPPSSTQQQQPAVVIVAHTAASGAQMVAQWERVVVPRLALAVFCNEDRPPARLPALTRFTGGGGNNSNATPAPVYVTTLSRLRNWPTEAFVPCVSLLVEDCAAEDPAAMHSVMERFLGAAPTANMFFLSSVPPSAVHVTVRYLLHRKNRRYYYAAPDATAAAAAAAAGGAASSNVAAAASGVKPQNARQQLLPAPPLSPFEVVGGVGGNPCVASTFTYLMCHDAEDRAELNLRVTQMRGLKRVLILTHNREVRDLKAFLHAKLGFKTFSVQRNTTSVEHDRTLGEFLRSPYAVLVAMDAYTGIDLSDVDAVIQYYPPQKSMPDEEWAEYLSYLGTTGNPASPTLVVTLVAPDDFALISNFMRRVGDEGPVLNVTPAHPRFADIVRFPRLVAEEKILKDRPLIAAATAGGGGGGGSAASAAAVAVLVAAVSAGVQLPPPLQAVAAAAVAQGAFPNGGGSLTGMPIVHGVIPSAAAAAAATVAAPLPPQQQHNFHPPPQQQQQQQQRGGDDFQFQQKPQHFHQQKQQQQQQAPKQHVLGGGVSALPLPRSAAAAAAATQSPPPQSQPPMMPPPQQQQHQHGKKQKQHFAQQPAAAAAAAGQFDADVAPADGTAANAGGGGKKKKHQQQHFFQPPYGKK